MVKATFHIHDPGQPRCEVVWGGMGPIPLKLTRGHYGHIFN